MIKTFRTEKRLPRKLWSEIYDYLEGKYIYLENRNDYYELNYFMSYNCQKPSASHYINYRRGDIYKKARFLFGADYKEKYENILIIGRKRKGDLTIEDLKVLVENLKQTYKEEYLLKIYSSGFNDELDGTYNNTYNKDSLEYKAYLVGSNHAIIGDDVSSIDLLTNEELLKIIKS